MKSREGDYFEARSAAEEDALAFRRLPSKENWLDVSVAHVWAEQERLLDKAGQLRPATIGTSSVPA